MTKVFISCLCLLLSCQIANAEGFRLQGNIKDLGNGTIQIIQTCIKGGVLSEIHVENGKFTFRKKLQHPQKIVIMFLPENKNDKSFARSIFTGNDVVEMKGSANDLKKLHISSNPYDIESKGVNASEPYKEVLKAFRKLDDSLFANDKSGVKRDKEYKKLCLDNFLKYLKGNIDFYNSYVGIYCFEKYFRSFDPEVISYELNHFNKIIKESNYWNSMNQYVQSENQLKIGDSLPEFSLCDEGGQIFSNKNLIGKTTVITFSASWCHWCHKELPYLLSAYDKHKTVQFVTINVDSDIKAFESYIEKHKVPWLVVFDKDGIKSGFASKIGITGIPYTVIIDENGLVNHKKVRREQLLANLNNE